MAPLKSTASRSQAIDNESDISTTPDPNCELMQQLVEQFATANTHIAALKT